MCLCVYVRVVEPRAAAPAPQNTKTTIRSKRVNSFKGDGIYYGSHVALEFVSEGIWLTVRDFYAALLCAHACGQVRLSVQIKVGLRCLIMCAITGWSQPFRDQVPQSQGEVRVQARQPARSQQQRASQFRRRGVALLQERSPIKGLTVSSQTCSLSKEHSSLLTAGAACAGGWDAHACGHQFDRR